MVFSSNFYYNERFEAAITVNVTCLLAMSGSFLSSIFLNWQNLSYALGSTPELYPLKAKVESRAYILDGQKVWASI